ncbi:MAG: hypothetical protein AAGF11_25140 [Myxococcota bacterium]
MASLVDRLLINASNDWRDLFFEQLDYRRLAERWERWPVNEVYDIVDFCKFLIDQETDQAQRLLRSMYPAIRRSFETDVLNAWTQIREFVLFGLRFSSLIKEDPDERQLRISREIIELIEPSDVGQAISSSRQRDWEPLAMLVDWIRVVAPDTCRKITAYVTVEPLLEQARALVKTMPRDLEMMFIMLIHDQDGSPFLSVIRKLQDKIEVLPLQLAILAPSVGIHVIDRGGQIRWGLFGEWPQWSEAVKQLSELEKHEVGLGVSFLESAVEEIANGLLFVQKNGDRDVDDFLSKVTSIAPWILDESCKYIEPEQAKKYWLIRLTESDEAKEATLKILQLVGSRPGPAQSIAEELMSRA